MIFCPAFYYNSLLSSLKFKSLLFCLKSVFARRAAVVSEMPCVNRPWQKPVFHIDKPQRTARPIWSSVHILKLRIDELIKEQQWKFVKELKVVSDAVKTWQLGKIGKEIKYWCQIDFLSLVSLKTLYDTRQVSSELVHKVQLTGCPRLWGNPLN